MAKKQSPKFVTPDVAARDAEAAKTARLRGLRLAKEAEDAIRAEKETAEREAAIKLRKSGTRRRALAADPAVASTGST
jgi:hypothetical protein